MNKRGFTLIELLVTIVIIGLIMSIVLPSATKVSNENKDELYKSYEEMVEEYAAVSEYRDRYYIELSDLEELSKVKNECEGYVLVDHTNEVLQYKAYINCGNQYKTDGFDEDYYKSVLTIPICKSGLIYNAANQALVESKAGYILSNHLRKDAGTQNVFVTISDKSRYSWYDKTQTDKVIRNCEIAKREVTVRANNITRIYGDEAPIAYTHTKINNIANENPLSMEPSYTVKNSSGTIVNVHYKTPVGVYTILPSTAVTANYTLKIQNGTFTINKKPLTPELNGCSDKTYDGNNIASCTLKPIQGIVRGDESTVTVTISGCTFNDADAAANKQVTCNIVLGGAASSNYELTTNVLTTTATINKKSVAIAWGSTTFTYNGGEQAPTASATGISGETIHIQRTTAIDAGTYTSTASCIKVTGGREKCSNYAFTGTTKEYTINKKSVAIGWGSTTTFTYNNNYQAPTASATSGVSGETINISRSTEIDAGTYTSIAKCDSVTGGRKKCENYTFTGTTKGYTINQKSVAIAWGATTFTYNGGEQAPTASATGVSGETIVITRTTAIDAGTYTSTASCNKVTGGREKCSNYAFTGTTKGYTINQKSVAIAWGSTTFTYNGGEQAPTASATGVSGETIVITRTTAIDAGTYTSTASCNKVTGGRGKCSNYTFTGTTKGYTINQKSVAIAWGSTTFTYNGGGQAPTASATGVTGETIVITRTTAIDAGTYTSTASCNKVTGGRGKCSNYTFTGTTKGYIINKKQLTVNTLSCSNKTYDGNRNASCTITYSGVISGDSVTPGATCTFDNANAGSGKTITCTSFTSNNSNYAAPTGSGTTTATINPQTCGSPTGISISSGGIVTWTSSSNCSGGQYQISIDNSNWSNASSGVNYKNTIIAASGTRTVYVKVIKPNDNYATSSPGIGSTTVFSVSLSKGEGISSVSGAGNYITGSTATIDAAVSTGYTWSKWSGTPDTSAKKYSVTISENWSTTATATINYYYVDLNGYLDGSSNGGIAGYGTCDVYINNSIVKNDVSDYYTQHPYNSTYEFKDCKATTGHTYNGVYSGSISGTIGTGNVSTSLNFTTNSYTITYHANGGTGAPASQTYTYATSGTINLSSVTPTRTGYTFAGWSTSSTATSASYSAGQSWNLSTASNYTLYAVWTANIYKVTLNNQSASSAGTTTVWYQYNTTKVVNGVTCYYYSDSSLSTCISDGYNITKPSRTGYTFGGYYTGTGGTGTNYVNSSGSFINNVYQTTGDKTLYAKWVANKIKITLDNNGGTGGTTNFWFYYGTSKFYSNEACTTQITSITRPTKKGYTLLAFQGDGTSGGNVGENYVAYDNKEFASDLATDIYKDATLKALWSANTYTVSYNYKGSYSGCTSSSSGNETTWSNTATYDSNYTVEANWWTCTGWRFIGWTSKTDDTDDGANWTGWSGKWTYVNGEYGISNGKLTLYARWSNKYTITYDANGGTGAPASQTYTYAATGTTNLSSTKPTRDGYTFLGWSLSSTATSATYSAGQAWKLSNDNDYRLYAVWSKVSYAWEAVCVGLGGTGTSATNSFYVYGYNFATYSDASYGCANNSYSKCHYECEKRGYSYYSVDCMRVYSYTP